MKTKSQSSAGHYRCMIFAMLVCAFGAINSGVPLQELIQVKSPYTSYNGWGMGVVLSNMQNYVEDLSWDKLDLWQTLYDQRVHLDGYVLANGTNSNSTLTIAMQGVYGLWTYKTVTNVIAYATQIYNGQPKPDVIMPVTCAGYGDTKYINTSATVECNVITATMQIQSVRAVNEINDAGYAQLLDCYNTCDRLEGQVIHTSALGGIYSPLSAGQLSVLLDRDSRQVPINVSDFVDPISNPLNMKNLTTSATLWSYNKLDTIASCAPNVSLVMRVPSQVVDGVVLYCALWNGILVGTTWEATWTSNFIPVVDCTSPHDAQAFGIILYPETEDVTGNNSYQSILIYNMSDLLDTASPQPKCRLDMYQDFAPEINNLYWAQLNSMAQTNFMDGTYTPGNCSSKDMYIYTGGDGAPQVLSSTLQTSLDMSTPVNYYTDFSWQTVNTYSSLIQRQNTTKLGPSIDGSMCGYLPQNDSEFTYGDANLGNGIVSAMLYLGVDAGGGGQHVSIIQALTAKGDSGFQVATVAIALNVGVTAIAAAAGTNAFTIKVPWLKASSNQMFIIILRVLMSLIEASVAQLGLISQMITLESKKKQVLTGSWVEQQLQIDIAKFVLVSDPIKYDVYSSTNLTLIGNIQLATTQWLILVLSMMVATSLVLYRWHFGPGSTIKDIWPTKFKNRKQENKGHELLEPAGHKKLDDVQLDDIKIRIEEQQQEINKLAEHLKDTLKQKSAVHSSRNLEP